MQIRDQYSDSLGVVYKTVRNLKFMRKSAVAMHSYVNRLQSSYLRTNLRTNYGSYVSMNMFILKYELTHEVHTYA